MVNRPVALQPKPLNFNDWRNDLDLVKHYFKDEIPPEIID